MQIQARMADAQEDNDEKMDFQEIIRQATIHSIPENDSDLSYTVDSEETAQDLFSATAPAIDLSDFDALLQLKQPKEEPNVDSGRIQVYASDTNLSTPFQSISAKRPIEEESHATAKKIKTASNFMPPLQYGVNNEQSSSQNGNTVNGLSQFRWVLCESLIEAPVAYSDAPPTLLPERRRPGSRISRQQPPLGRPIIVESYSLNRRASSEARVGETNSQTNAKEKISSAPLGPRVKITGSQLTVVEGKRSSKSKLASNLHQQEKPINNKKLSESERNHSAMPTDFQRTPTFIMPKNIDPRSHQVPPISSPRIVEIITQGNEEQPMSQETYILLDLATGAPLTIAEAKPDETSSSDPKNPQAYGDLRSAHISTLMELLKTEIDRHVAFLKMEHEKVCPKYLEECQCKTLEFFNVWSDESKKLVFEIVGKRLAFFDSMSLIYDRHAAAESFINWEIISLWPKDWMTVDQVMQQCKDIFTLTRLEVNQRFRIIRQNDAFLKRKLKNRFRKSIETSTTQFSGDATIIRHGFNSEEGTSTIGIEQIQTTPTADSINHYLEPVARRNSMQNNISLKEILFSGGQSVENEITKSNDEAAHSQKTSNETASRWNMLTAMPKPLAPPYKPVDADLRTAIVLPICSYNLANSRMGASCNLENNRKSMNGQKYLRQFKVKSQDKIKQSTADLRSAKIFTLMEWLKDEIDKQVSMLHSEHTEACPKDWKECESALLDYFRKNIWSDYTKELVFEIVGKTLALIETQSFVLECRRTALEIFLQRELVPLWPKNWITIEHLMSLCKDIVAMSKSALHRNFGTIGSRSVTEKPGTSTISSSQSGTTPNEAASSQCSNPEGQNKEIEVETSPKEPQKSRKQQFRTAESNDALDCGLESKSMLTLLGMLKEEIEQDMPLNLRVARETTEPTMNLRARDKEPKSWKLKSISSQNDARTKRKLARDSRPLWWLFKWNDNSKKILDAIVNKRLAVLNQDQLIKDKNRALKAFLLENVVPLWPQGGMTVTRLTQMASRI